MRRATYSRKQIRLPNASSIGFDVTTARAGYWITDRDGGTGRVVGRIEQSADNYACVNARGFILAIMLGSDLQAAGVRWIDPRHVTRCTQTPPAALLAWLTSDEFMRTPIPKLLAMNEHGTLQERYIGSRNDPAKPYNDPARAAAYNSQFLLGVK